MRAAFTNKTKQLDVSLSQEKVNFPEIRGLLELLQGKRDTLVEINARIQQTMIDDADTTEEDLGKEINVCDEYELTLNKLKAKVEALEVKNSADDVSQRQSVSVQNSIYQKNRRPFKLPVLELKKFSGDLKEWLPFWSQFKKIHEDSLIDNGDKFQYLIQATIAGSRARELVESFPATNENYEKAIKCLKKRYGRDDLLVEVYVRDLLGLVIQNTMSTKKTSLAFLYDKLECQLRALETLQVTTDRCASMLMPLVESCLPEDILRAWQRSGLYTVQDQIDDSNPTDEEQDEAQDETVQSKNRLNQLMKFLQLELENEQKIKLALSGFGVTKIQDKNDANRRERNVRSVPPHQNLNTAAGLLTTVKKVNCAFCDGKHNSELCEKVEKMSIENRKNVLYKRGYCYNCLIRGHRAGKCRSKSRCTICNQKHNVIICQNIQQESNRSKPELERQPDVTARKDDVLANIENCEKVSLQTFQVKLKGENSEKITRAMIDTGSQRSYILREVAVDMRYKPMRKERVQHTLFAGLTTDVIVHDVYKIKLSDLDDTYHCTFEVLDQSAICGKIEPISPGPWLSKLKANNIQLTDFDDRPIEILFGADTAARLFTGQQQQITPGLIAMETRLGWTLLGCVPERLESENTAMITTNMIVKDANITDLWSLDVLGITDPIEKKRKEEIQLEAQKHFLKTVTIDEEGRYLVHLPWLVDHPPLSSNYDVSLKRLNANVKRLKASGYYDEYEAVLDEWLQENIIEEVPPDDKEKAVHYLPHRHVVKLNSTTKIRPVFDASAREKGHPSLNDCLEKGPNLIELIPSMLIRFRLRKIGVIADIRKAFLQISLVSQDRNFLRFLWYNRQGELKTYRHKRVVFGVTCSPFLLGSVIQYHLNKMLEKCKVGENEYSEEVIEKLLKSFYVDNCVTSVDNEKQLKRFIHESINIMNEASFELRGWEYSFLDYVDENKKSNVLGMLWERKEDFLMVNIENINSFEISPVTKRSILSATHRIFDPIGVTCPVTLMPKLLLQQIWSEKIGWDQQVNEEIEKQFLKWYNDLSYMKQISIPRWLLSTIKPAEYTVHIFCDASQYAYAAVIFLRTETIDDVNVQLIQAKSRISPMNKANKKMTIPRLELLAANIGARLYQHVINDLDMPIAKVEFWSDSTTVLAWITREEQWSVFVRNRVNEIRTITSKEQWRHIPGIYNPADLPSRGCSAKKLLESQWWNGPSWLKEPNIYWPRSEISHNETEINNEKKKTVTSSISMMCTDQNDWYYRYFSKYNQIVRLIAWILRFKENCFREKNRRIYGELTADEFIKAEIKVLKLIQKDSFAGINDEKLTSLQPYEGTDGLIRLKTKISHSGQKQDFCYPIVLPDHHHPVVRRLILKEQNDASHAGVQTMMTILRKRFWILKARRSIRTVLNKCMACKRYTAKRIQVQSPPLPIDRVRDAKIFEIVGIDLAGPIYLKSNERNRCEKVWICLFTCAVFRAVHLELLTSLSTERFIMCLRKFISRRGRPSIIYTDNGTNFVGTANVLSSIDWEKIQVYSSAMKIKWKFNPPAAAWWGGWWERLIGLLKQLLRRILGRAFLDYEEMQTILYECEAIINARPLTYVSDDSSDLIPLTPDLFLKEIEEIGVPDLDLAEVRIDLSKRAEYRQKIRQMLKERFYSEYLGKLMLYAKKVSSKVVAVGDLVIVENENLKRQDWPLAKVEELVAGSEGVIRLVKLRTSSGILLRPIQRILPLEMDVSASNEERDIIQQPGMNDFDEAAEEEEERSEPASALVEPKLSRSGRIIKPPIKLDL